MTERPGAEFSFKEVVVATDFSEVARAATAWAVEIARAHGARLTLAHAVRLPAPFPDYLGSKSDFTSNLREAARAKLEEEVSRLETDGCEVETRLLVGAASESVLETAEELSADLVVIGTRGLSGLPHLLLGSTAERVVQNARCPVLTTHGGGQKPGRVRSILVPTDFSADARMAACAARDLLQFEEEARLLLLNAYQLPIEYTAYGTAPVSPAFLEEARVRAEADLEELASRLRREGLAVQALAREGYPSQTILATAEAEEVDLIAMGTHGRSGMAHLLWGSTAERVVQHAPCPVLTVRRQE